MSTMLVVYGAGLRAAPWARKNSTAPIPRVLPARTSRLPVAERMVRLGFTGYVDPPEEPVEIHVFAETREGECDYELPPYPGEDVSACMDSSSFARGLFSGGRIDCSRVSGLYVVPWARDHDGLFARWLPSGNTGFSPFAESGFCQRRSDLFAVNQTPSQSWVGCSSSGCAATQRAPSLADRSRRRSAAAPRPCARSCWPAPPSPHYCGGARTRH
jgi:hypothetical protein